MIECTPGPIVSLASYLIQCQYELSVYMGPGHKAQNYNVNVDTKHKIIMAAVRFIILRDTWRLWPHKCAIQLNNASSMFIIYFSAFHPGPCI